jgi:hypothetical protein
LERRELRENRGGADESRPIEGGRKEKKGGK